MATRPQQVVILRTIRDNLDKALRVALVYQQSSVFLIPEQPETTVTLTGAQQGALAAVFDGLVASVKSDAATL